LRLFVALALPVDFLERLDHWRSDAYAMLPAFRLPASSGLHVTLVFLGYQYERDLERLKQLALADPPGRLDLQAGEVVPVPPRRPRLHALELEDGSGTLTAWQSEVSARLAAARLYRPEKRPFWPHLTIARAKRGREREAVGVEPPCLPRTLQEPFSAEQVALYSSTLSPAGAVYEALASAQL
jgi:2'-5' RNA ligase